MLIVYYHNVIAGQPDAMDRRCGRVSGKEFADQMARLAARHRFIGLGEMLALLDQGRDAPEALVITFDDALAGVLELAQPILAAAGATAAVFVPTAQVREPGAATPPLHFDQIEVAFRLCPQRQADLEHLGLGRPRLDKPARRVRAMKEAKRALKLLPEDQRARAHEALIAALGVSPDELAEHAAADPKYRVMNLDELVRLKDLGWEIGSHTMTHRTLAMLPPDQQRDELAGSRQWLARNLGLKDVALAYPYGEPAHVGPDAPSLARELGYTCALSTVPGPVTPTSDRFFLPRGEFGQV